MALDKIGIIKRIAQELFREFRIGIPTLHIPDGIGISKVKTGF
jgi:hypothetical protein